VCMRLKRKKNRRSESNLTVTCNDDKSSERMNETCHLTELKLSISVTTETPLANTPPETGSSLSSSDEPQANCTFVAASKLSNVVRRE